MKQTELKISKDNEKNIKKILVDRGVADFVISRGIDWLIDSWKNFVESCEKGYTLSIDDYTNDLTSRDIIHNVLDKLEDNNLRNKIKIIIQPFDLRFRQLLVDTQIQTWPDEDKTKWWFFGIVKNANGELLEDLNGYYGKNYPYYNKK
jgi:hypothetical protein